MNISIPPRMNFFLPLVLFIASGCQPSFAQQSNRTIDSLKNVLQTAVKDTNKVNSLNALSKIYSETALNAEARNYADSALSLAQKLNFKEGIADAYCNIGLQYEHLANYPEALKNYMAAAKMAEDAKDKKRTAFTYIATGRMHWHIGNYPGALKNTGAALKISQDIGDKTGVANAYEKLGSICRNQGNYAEAIKNFLSALKISEELGDKQRTAACYDLIGIIYTHNGNYSEALKFFQAGLKSRQGLGPIAGSQNAIGMTYAKMGNYAEALKNCQAALRYFKGIHDKYSTAATCDNLGEIYRYQGNYTEALKNYQACLKIIEEIDDKYGMVTSYNNIGKTYVGLGNPSKANEYLIKGLNLSKKIGDKENIKSAYEGLARSDSAAGNYRRALAYYKLYTDYKDSLFNETSMKQTAQMRAQYESEKKDKEIELLNKEKAIQTLHLKKQKLAQNYLIGGLALLFILAFFIYRNYHHRQKLKLLTLRNKIASDLHDDVGSTLSSISIFSQMAQQQSKETIPMLETIGESSRKMLDAMADIVWTIKPENDQFDKIIMRMRNFAYELLGAKKIDFEFLADDEVAKINLPMEVRKNLYLIFKEATNNMVKYAQADKAMFAIKGEKNYLTMMIRDNGKGFDANSSTEGNGLKNMMKRASEIGAKLLIESFPGNGTTIQIRIAV